MRQNISNERKSSRETLLGVLGLPAEGSNVNVKKAYKALAKIHHPDQGGNEELFKNIAEAYEKLTKPE